MLLSLFLTFFRIGLFTFGGGYAMISVIEHTCVEKKQWITHEDLVNVTVIAESTPGPVAINCATFVGYKQKERLGSMPMEILIHFCAYVGVSVYYIIKEVKAKKEPSLEEAKPQE